MLMVSIIKSFKYLVGTLQKREDNKVYFLRGRENKATQKIYGELVYMFCIVRMVERSKAPDSRT